MRLQLSEDLNEVGATSSKTAHSHGFWQEVLALCWLLARGLSSLPHRPLYWVFECPYNMAAGFPQSQGSEREEEHRGCSNACSDRVSEVPCCHSGYICSLGENHYVQSTLKGRRIKFQFLKGGLSNIWGPNIYWAQSSWNPWDSLRDQSR